MKCKTRKRWRERRKRWIKKWTMGAGYNVIKINKPTEVNVVKPKIGWFRRFINYIINLFKKLKI